jgi:hypothetical protein
MIVNLDLYWYRTKVDINTIVRQIHFYRTHPRLIEKNNHVNWHEITYIRTILPRLNLELEDLETFLPMTRRKRGLLDLGGHALKFLFGTATSSELTDAASSG